MENGKRFLIKIGEWFFRHRDFTPIPFWLFLFAATFVWRDSRSQLICPLIGLCLIIAGEWLRMLSIKYARSITRTRSGKTGEWLIREGPFRYTRNPIYIGNGLIGLGLSLTSGFFGVAFIFFFLFIAQYIPIIAWEEYVLEEKFGDNYRQYRKEVPCWVGKSRIDSTPSSTDVEVYGFRKIFKSERYTIVAILVIGLLMQISGIVRIELF